MATTPARMIEAGLWEEEIAGHAVRYRMSRKGYGWRFAVDGGDERGFYPSLNVTRRCAAKAIGLPS